MAIAVEKIHARLMTIRRRDAGERVDDRVLTPSSRQPEPWPLDCAANFRARQQKHEHCPRTEWRRGRVIPATNLQRTVGVSLRGPATYHHERHARPRRRLRARLPLRGAAGG